MKFSCYKSDLVEALSFVSRAAAVKPMTPVLSGVFIHTEGSAGVELQANNNSTGIAAKIPVNVEVPGATVVNAKRFFDFARNMPDDTITLTLEDNTLALESGGAHVDLLTMNPDDFPKIKAEEMPNTFKVRVPVLAELIRRTVYTVAKDESRPVFTGVNFIFRGEDITAVATDTHRLAFAKGKLAEDCGNIFEFVIRSDTLRDLSARLDSRDAAETVTINYNGKSAAFTFNNVFVTTRIIEGQFPPYDRVIPKESVLHVKVNTAELKEAVKFVSGMSKETEYNTIKFDIARDGIDISANSPEVGGASKPVEADVDGDDLIIKFNVDYISDVLKVVTDEKLLLEFNDRYSPAKITEPGNDNFIYIATPVRT